MRPRLPGGGRLADAERRVLVVRQHPWLLVRPALWMALPLLVLLGVFVLTAVAPNALFSQNSGLLVVADLALLVVMLAHWCLHELLDWYACVYIITSQRVIGQVGLVAIQRREVPLKNIEESNYSISGAQARFFDFGDLRVHTSGAHGSLVFRAVAHPRRVQALLAAQVRAYRQQGGVLSPADMPSVAELALRRIVQGDAVARSMEPTVPFRPPSQLSRRVHRRLNLLPEEVILDSMRRHPLVLARAMLVPLMCLIAVLVLPGLWETARIATASMVVGLGIMLWLGWHILDWANDLYIVTSERLIELVQTPLFFEMRNAVQLRAVQDIVLTVSSAGARVLNVGDVVIETGGNGPPLVFRTVADPERLQNQIASAIESLRTRDRQREADRLAGTLSEWFAEYHRLNRSAP